MNKGPEVRVYEITNNSAWLDREDRVVENWERLENELGALK